MRHLHAGWPRARPAQPRQRGGSRKERSPRGAGYAHHLTGKRQHVCRIPLTPRLGRFRRPARGGGA
ncbi:hypothetical protein BSIN_1774 [Burkholderia singularis]|uniref:Uncharacterized protein n=1 Tax=Burkholderia singularis TaxID=1503053 RepID=A0A238GZS9_9BURK|nr:hypothetical protein BSIN_1774 [Burkholderia singularis]